MNSSDSIIQAGGADIHQGDLRVSSCPEEYCVILHKDAYHEVPSVAAMLTEIIAALSANRAQTIAEQAWTNDRAVVIVCAKVQAQQYQDQLTEQYQLTVTLEAA